MNSIEKALAVMRALSAPNGPHRLGDLSDRSGLTRPSVHRILQILVEGNFAQARGDGSYSSGLAMRAISSGSDTNRDIAEGAKPILADLQQSTGHTVHFAVRVGDAAVYLAKVEGDKPYQMASRVGMQIQLHCTAIGKAMLAAMPTTEVDAYFERLSERQQPLQKAPDRDQVGRGLEAIRQRGYSLDDEENEPNVRCVGAVVRDSAGSPIGGISISGLAFVLDRAQLHELAPLVKAAADDISRLAGYTKDAA